MKKIMRGLYGLSGLCILFSLLAGILLDIRTDALPGQVECWIVPRDSDSVKQETLLKLQKDKALTMLKEWTWAAVCNSTLVSARKSVFDVEVRHVGIGYGEVAGVQMLKGRFIWKEEVEAAEKVMVVDEKLAFELFGLVNCLGYKVEYGGETYEIIGVCAADSLITKKAEYRAFVPDGFKAGLEKVGIFGRVGPGRGTIAGEALKNALSSSFPGSTMELYNLQKQKLSLRQKLFINVRLVLLILLVAIAVKLYKWFRLKLGDWKKGLERCYFREFLREYLPELALVAILLSGFISLAVLSWQWTRFELVLPAGLIPDDLTDVGQLAENINRVFLEYNRGASDLPASMLQVNFMGRLADGVILVFWLSLSARFGVLRPWGRTARAGESRLSAVVMTALDRVGR